MAAFALSPVCCIEAALGRPLAGPPPELTRQNRLRASLCAGESVGLPLRGTGLWRHPGRRRDGGAVLNAFEVSGPGSIDTPLMNSMRAKIQEQLEAEKVEVKDAYGDGQHVSIAVVSSLFEGKRSVERQRMVYKAIWEELQTVVHAVDSLTTKTPSEV